jgi:hypothetical protein
MREHDEPRAVWRKSSYSNGSGGNCVEVRLSGGVAQVRDSKDLSGPALSFTADEWRAFLSSVRDGDFGS